MAFQCVVVTPEQQLLDEPVRQVILPAHDGSMGVLTGRAPILVKLGTGKLEADLASGQRRTLLVDGGIAQMKDDKLTVLTDAAWNPADLSADAARTEYAAATAKPITDERSAADRERALRRAKLKESMAGAK
jgi:F-type H+-transporting ATPase subunit epsilon